MRSITQLCAVCALCALRVWCVRLHFGGYLTPGSQEELEWGGTLLNGRRACMSVCVVCTFSIVTQL